jgi:hypothetical protein
VTTNGLRPQPEDGDGERPVDDRLSPEEAARILFQEPRAVVDFTARDEDEARRAVEEFALLFKSAPGVFTHALAGARAGAETLSGDRLQGLAEIIQNADDAGASYLRFQVVGRHLVAVHDGAAVTLSDVLALATPWLTNKTENELATGRFGIGLMTLQALSNILDVHSGPYHVRLGDPTIAAIELSDLLFDLPESHTTELCIPLLVGGLDTEEIAGWLGSWDDSALLFLLNVRTITLSDSEGQPVRTLHLAWHEDQSAQRRVDGHKLTVQRRHATAPDGRSWLVHSTEVPRPAGVNRAHKALGARVPLGIALALHLSDHGVIYAGLPLVETAVPLRVNAQFDPLTGRTGLASTDWNVALLPFIADLWVELVQDLFVERPTAAWDVIPLPGVDGRENDLRSVVAQMESLLLDRARTELATHAAVVIQHEKILLTDLAVEVAALDGVIEPIEVARIAGLAQSLPFSARDVDGRWREVLNDWRNAGAPMPPPVTVTGALALLDDSSRSVVATVTLVALALKEGLASTLNSIPCVSTVGGQRVTPPTADSARVLMEIPSGLAEQLGMGLSLAPEHLAKTDAAIAVLDWLREIGAVIDGGSDEVVVRRLAAAGRAGKSLAEPLLDDQLRALRDVLEQLSPSDRLSLGYDVGQAITISAFRYDAQGQVEQMSARPTDVYLSRAIDREQDSFASAADKTPGLLWTHNRYAKQLRSSLGQVGGLGSQKFLGLLGAERAPRLVARSGQMAHYAADRRRGLPKGAFGSPAQRNHALKALGAEYTLDDLDSPDLRAVIVDIAAEKESTRRCVRASALLGALGRAWGEHLADGADVIAASKDYGWQRRGTTKAFWLWSVGATAWLDDTDGVLRAPLDLMLKTPGTIAVFGPDAPEYLRPEFDAPNRREILAALGVSGEPSTRDLVERLRGLRSLRRESGTLATDAAIIYQAIADQLARRANIPGDLSEQELRLAFGDGDGLVHTDLGWRTPTRVFAGDPVFGGRRPFVPQVPRAERLWNVLKIRQPSEYDCLRVIGEVARTRRAPEGDDVLILLKTLRFLADRLAAIPELPRPLVRRLGSVSVWTTRGWTTKRPVYAVDDPALMEGLQAEVAVWEPEGEVAQFDSLLTLLRITRLGTDVTTIVDPDAATPDDETSELWSAAVSQLQDDLVRNDPKISGTLILGWDRLRDFDVRIDIDLRVRVDGLIGRPPVEIEVATKVDVASGILYLRDRRLLRQVDGGGRAVAGLFTDSDKRYLSYAWLAACDAADEGRLARGLLLFEQGAADVLARRERDMAERTAVLGQEIAWRHEERSRRWPKSSTTSAPAAVVTPIIRALSQSQPLLLPRTRVLVDPLTLVVLNPDGQAHGGWDRSYGTKGSRKGSLPLFQPDRDVRVPQAKKIAPTFTLLDKESVGMAVALKVLSGDEQEIVDLRAQHGVGADAVDSLNRFFELKVHLGDEPDVVRLEESEIRRALSTPDFFLVIVSNLEGADARPKVRIIIDPVHQLIMTKTSSVNFAGVRGAEHSLVYNLGHLP